MSPTHPGLTLRPYQVMCAICSLGEATSGRTDPASAKILDAIRQSPDRPLTLTCNAGDVFAYQDPGTKDDTPEGLEFNRRRDLEILYKLNLFPGCTLPARIVFNRLLERIEDGTSICGYGTPTSAAWKGCPKALSDSYKRGREKGIAAIIPPRPEREMKLDKKTSMKAMHKAKTKDVRPHILLCALCQYGGGTKPPYPEDNLPELIELILEKPDTLIRLVPGADWMMCAPCPSRSSKLGACVCNKGSGGLPNQMRDLRVLQKLGLAYGSTLKARNLYTLIFKRFSGMLALCGIEHSKPSVWWTGCGSATLESEAFQRGKKRLMAALKK